MTENELLEVINKYFKTNIFINHKNNVLKTHTKLSSYKINPIIVKYLSKVLEKDITAEGIAKALYYPRVLGTSINTSFGTRIQMMFVEIGLAEPSLIQGMDIEYIDKRDGRKKYCQLKSGPNTINSEDVKPLLDKFSRVTNLARTNSLSMNNNDLVIGVLYGEEAQLSQHYKKINERYPVIIGTEFWYGLTGFPDFYSKLVNKLDDLIQNMETDDFFIEGLNQLVAEIKESELFSTK